MSVPDAEIWSDGRDGPVLRDRRVVLPGGGTFVGWSGIRRQAKPFRVQLLHDLGTGLYTVQLWFWRQGTAARFLSWTGRRPHPEEAGPVAIWTTSQALHLLFEADKPLFAEFDGNTGRYEMHDAGWVGALVTPG
jgi:hypothetical protein